MNSQIERLSVHSLPLINGFVAALFIVYPLVIYFGFSYFDARFLGFCLIFLGVLNLAASRQFAVPSAKSPGSRPLVIFLSSIFIGLIALISNSIDYLLFYPVCMNAAMFTLFAISLFKPPTIIEHLARLGNPDLSENGVLYTRAVTIVWCAFFIFNGAAALYTATKTSFEIWVLYNGLISYGLMGLLFIGEYAVRMRKYRKDNVRFSQ